MITSNVNDVLKDEEACVEQLRSQVARAEGFVTAIRNQCSCLSVLPESEAYVFARPGGSVAMLSRMLRYERPSWKVYKLLGGWVAFSVPKKESGKHVIDVSDFLNSLSDEANRHA